MLFVEHPLKISFNPSLFSLFSLPFDRLSTMYVSTGCPQRQYSSRSNAGASSPPFPKLVGFIVQGAWMIIMISTSEYHLALLPHRRYLTLIFQFPRYPSLYLSSKCFPITPRPVSSILHVDVYLRRNPTAPLTAGICRRFTGEYRRRYSIRVMER
jgi:hypothetical protein